MPKQKPPGRGGARKIFIVDDHPLFREGLAALIGRETDLALCGFAADARQALAEAERCAPDIALVDISLPGRSGLELIKELKIRCPRTLVLVISMHEESLYAERAVRSGGNGYVMKQEGPEKILHAIRQVLAGQIYLSSTISARILGALSGRRPKADSPIARLSDRELEVLLLIGQGKDSHAIARALHLSPKTIDAHRGNIKEKLELKNATELICYAARWVEAQQGGRR